MTVQELVELLEKFDGGQEVRIAHQPTWPFEYEIAQVVCPNPQDQYEVLQGDDGWSLFDRETGKQMFDCPNYTTMELAEEYFDQITSTLVAESTIVYIGEGVQIGYLPTPVASALGWK